MRPYTSEELRGFVDIAWITGKSKVGNSYSGSNKKGYVAVTDVPKDFEFGNPAVIRYNLKPPATRRQAGGTSLFFAHFVSDKVPNALAKPKFDGRSPSKYILYGRFGLDNLRDDRCIKRVSFRSGHHELDVQITDEAGNAIGAERVEFDV